ncbi:unnamed protein product [Pleuronectes platessa]|uniref:Uncharacterized protein n=1 Tax=Pleuronectes platessa TaxID=8262 RepID=A0A9N7VWY7_PLEPL|nr:unnamed protein product [Pleuronectes platessa]
MGSNNHIITNSASALSDVTGRKEASGVHARGCQSAAPHMSTCSHTGVTTPRLGTTAVSRERSTGLRAPTTTAHEDDPREDDVCGQFRWLRHSRHRRTESPDEKHLSTSSPTPLFFLPRLPPTVSHLAPKLYVRAVGDTLFLPGVACLTTSWREEGGSAAALNVALEVPSELCRGERWRKPLGCGKRSPAYNHLIAQRYTITPAVVDSGREPGSPRHRLSRGFPSQRPPTRTTPGRCVTSTMTIAKRRVEADYHMNYDTGYDRD